MPNPNEIDPSTRDASGEREMSRARDGKVRRLDRAGNAKDESPLGHAPAPDVRALNPAGRKTDAKSAAEPSPNPASDTADAPKKSRLRPLMFALLPLALVVGAYWYVSGGQVISMDDAYVEADKVGVSTDMAGIVKEVGVTENQHVDAQQILYRLDSLQFRLALDRADAQIGRREAVSRWPAAHRRTYGRRRAADR